jgi:diguanylate cyclase (GGDEF)-like protein/putative nucleotidyltransferase with HDIG domain
MNTSRDQVPGTASDRGLLVSVLIALYVAGPTFGMIGVVLPHSAAANDSGIVGILVVAYVCAGILFLFRNRMPDWGFQVAAGFASILISAGIYFAGPTTVTGAFYYLWVILGASYLFDRPRVALQVVIVAVGLGAALLLKPSFPGMLQVWIVATGTLAIVATVSVITRERVAALVAQLAEAADTDPLTELLNRRGFNKQLDLELERAERSGTGVSLICGDLDHFKQINDRYGHQVGDEVLTEIADVLRRHARRIDCVARIGGEEFALLAPGADSHGAFLSAERLRHRVREALASRHPGLTISFGVASYPADATTGERLLRAADESLYAAKTLGRDRTVIYSREVVGALVGDSGQSLTPNANLATLLTLAEALDIRDRHTALHSKTVGHYAESMALELGLASERVERIRLAGVLHDIGKIGVADSILFKPGPLDDEEWEELRSHPEIGARLLSGPGLADLRAWVLAHHERLDGTGYPMGLSDGEIPLEARIIAVADAFEAITSDRPYRAGRSGEEALAELRNCAGTQFDPQVVDALAARLDAIERDPAAREL